MPSTTQHEKKRPKRTPKEKLARFAKRSAWLGGSLAAVAIYNHIDAGIVAAQADQSSTIRSRSGRISLAYKHIPRDLVRVISALPDKIDDNLKRLPFARHERELLLKSSSHLEVRAALEWEDSSDQLLRVGPDGTIRLNATKIAAATQQSSDTLTQAEAEEQASSALANTITVEMVEWAGWRNVAQQLDAAKLPLRLIASSEIQSSILVSKHATRTFLNGAAPSASFKALNASWIPADPCLEHHSISYAALKRHLETATGLSDANSMIVSNSPIINFAPALTLARYSDYFSWSALIEPREISNPRTLSDLISKRRQQALLEAKAAGHLLVMQRLQALENDFSLLLTEGHDSVTEPFKNISDSGVLRGLSARVLQLYQPFEAAQDRTPPWQLQAITKVLIRDLSNLYQQGERATSLLPPPWANRDALEAVATLQEVVLKHFDSSRQPEIIALLDSIAIKAERALVENMAVEAPDFLGSSAEIKSAISFGQKIIDQSAASNDLIHSHHDLVATSLLSVHSQTPGQAAVALPEGALILLNSHLVEGEIARLLFLCKASVHLISSTTGGDDLVRYPAPEEIAQFLSSEFLAKLPRSSQAVILRELANYADNIALEQSYLMLDPGNAHYDPAQRAKDFINLHSTVVALGARERDACVEALLSVPSLLRSEIIERLTQVRDEMSRGEFGKVDSEVDIFGYFSRSGVLASALERTIQQRSSFKGMVAFDLVNQITRGAAERTSWAANVDIFASSSAKQLSWGSLIADGEFAHIFRRNIEEHRTPLRQIFPLVEKEMQTFEIRSSRGVGWIVNRAGDVIDNGAGRPPAYGIFHQNPRQGLGSFESATTPQVGAILVGKQYTSDFDSFSRGAHRWQGCLSDVYRTDIEVHTVSSVEQIKQLLKRLARAAILQGKREEFLVVVAAHGSAAAVSAEGLGLRSEGSRYKSAAWLENGYLEEGALKSIINKFVAPYFKRVSIIFDSCHSGGWTE